MDVQITDYNFATFLYDNFIFLDMIVIYITCKDDKEAIKISKALLKKRLIACANLFPIKSVYRWHGRIKEENEVMLIVKTKDHMYDEIKDDVEKMHSYDVPCIEAIKVADINKSYLKWLFEETSKPVSLGKYLKNVPKEKTKKKK